MKTKSKNLLWDPKVNILQCNEGLRGQSVFFTGLKAREVGSIYRIAILRQAEPHRQKNAFCVLKRRVKKNWKDTYHPKNVSFIYFHHSPI